jgi:hypothetical protein
MNDSLDISITSSLANESLATLLGDISETAIDSALESGTLRDIPIIGMLTGVMKAGRDIKIALFIRKVAVFLKELSQIPIQDRQEFVNRFDSKEKQHEFGQTILLLLERAEDMKKPHLIAKIINAYILGKIDESDAFRLCTMINRCYTQDLEVLRNYHNNKKVEPGPITQSLFSAGFLSNHEIERKDPQWIGETGYYLNKYGELFISFAL